MQGHIGTPYLTTSSGDETGSGTQLEAQKAVETKQYMNSEYCDCLPKRWGCEAHNGKPSSRHIEETKQAVQQTVIPTQAYITVQNQNITSNECSASAAWRKRHDQKQYMVNGNFTRNDYDVSKSCETEGDSFCEEGWKCDDFWDYN